MNILLSYNWLKEYIDPKLSPKELARLLSLHSMSVERILPEVELLSDKVVLGEIKAIKPHPDADRLQIAQVYDGKEQFQVVCGAPNIKLGMKILFTKPGAMVRWHGEGEPVLLEPAKIRGVDSFGMITDDSEVGLSDSLNEKGVTDYSYLKAKVGTPMAKALGLDDVIFDIEITTNRIDAGCVMGMAREIAALTGKPKNEGKIAKLKKTASLPLTIKIEDKDKCLGFNGVVLDGVKVEPSPEWMQRRLRSAGLTPINNVVDVTNYVMHEMGHPLHAFDYDKVEGGSLIVRSAKRGEKLVTLDEKDEELMPDMVVVADKKQALALGGVMGGASSMITEGTIRVLLEGASWNREVIRKTAMKLDKFSDASSYFSKGVSPQLASEALLRAVELLLEITDAKVASQHVSVGYKAYKPKSVSMSLSRAEELIGAKLKASEVKKQLNALGFNVHAGGDRFKCSVPHWRQYDVAIEEDLIEETARLFGYQNIPSRLPSGQMPVPEFNLQLDGELDLKQYLKSAGLTEVYTYSMVSEELHAIGGRQIKEAMRLLNPLDEEHVVMRTSLLPSLVEVASQNQGLFKEQRLFEIANIYEPQKVDELPDEIPMFSALITSGNLERDFRELKGILEQIFRQHGLEDEVIFSPESSKGLVNKQASYDVMLGDQWVATLGVLNHMVARKIGLKQKAVVAILDTRKLFALSQSSLSYAPIPKFPAVSLDLSISVVEETPWAQVEREVIKAAGPLLRSVELFDIYRKDNQKSFAFRLEYRDDERTLEMKEVEELQKAVVDALQLAGIGGVKR